MISRYMMVEGDDTCPDCGDKTTTYVCAECAQRLVAEVASQRVAFTPAETLVVVDALKSYRRLMSDKAFSAQAQMSDPTLFRHREIMCNYAIKKLEAVYSV